MIKLSLLNEVMIPVADYFRIGTAQEKKFDWGLPALFALIGAALIQFADTAQIQSINTTIINFSAILVGFSVASLTIIAASASKAIDDLKGRDTDRTLLGNPVSLYRLTVTNFVYILVVEFFVVFLGIVHLLAQPLLSDAVSRWSYVIVLYFFAHTIVLNLRNLCAFYFTFIK
jgi:hypothetical protein